MNLEIQSIIYNILTVAIGVLLFVAGIADIRKRQISKGMMLVLLLTCCAVIPVKKDFGIMNAAGGLTVGFCAIGISLAPKEQIGIGDGIVIAGVGLALGMYKCFLVVCAATFVMCITAVLVLLLRKGNKQTRLPFLPALFMGYLLCGIL